MVCQETGLLAGDGWEPLPGTWLSFPWLVDCDPQPARANNYRGPKIFTSAQTEGIRVILSKGCSLVERRGCVRLQRTGWGARPGIWGAGGASRQRAAGGRGRVKVPRPPTSAVASHLVPVLWELASSTHSWLGLRPTVTWWEGEELPASNHVTPAQTWVQSEQWIFQAQAHLGDTHLENKDKDTEVRMSSDRLLRGQKLARESAVLTAPRRLHNTKLDDFDMVKTIGTGERLFNVKSLLM